MALSPSDIKSILDALEASDWDSACVTVDGVTISVARNGAALPGTAPVASAPLPAPVAAVAAPAGPAAEPTQASTPTGHLVTAPSVGVFWRSPRPGEPPFVEVGDRVQVGDTLCIVEMMKLMTNIVADVAGVVTAIHQENAAQIEFGAPLVSIDPA
ncbi:MAG: acetyl-CoA carboxylase biotin carboxyl carrier protein [Sporichthyaceae bacterium]